MEQHERLILGLLEKKIKLFQLGGCSAETIVSAINDLQKMSQMDISHHRILTAQLFEEILRQTQELYCSNYYNVKNIPNDHKQNILNLYRHIHAIGTEAEDEEKNDGSVLLVSFLRLLETHNGSECFPTYADSEVKEIKEYVESLSDLEEVRFIFDIKNESDRTMFPIEEMLSYVIKDTRFLSKAEGLQAFHMHIFSYAVRFFKKGSDNDEMLKDLITDCHLKFIEYLNPGDEILDTDDLTNYRTNGVMVFVKGGCDKKILIRSNRNGYFANSIINEYDYEVKEEKSKDQSYTLGWFVELPVIYDTLTSATELMKIENQRKEVLRLFFNGYRNIFLKKTLYIDDSGAVRPTNPFTRTDEYVVKGSTHIKRENLNTIFEDYYNLPIMKSSQYFFNRLFLGTFISLMEIDDSCADEILDFKASESDFYQNSIIEEWIKKQGSRTDRIEKLLMVWYSELEYCIRREKTKGQNEAPNIAGHEVKAQGFFPFAYDYSRLIKNLSSDFVNGADIFMALVNDIDGNRNVTIQISNKAKVLPSEIIIDRDKILSTLSNGQRCYIIESNGNYYIDNQNLSNIIYNMKIIWKNCLSFETACNIPRPAYEDAVRCMYLHRRGITEGSQNCFTEDDFDDQAFYRIIHNMLRYGVDKDKTEDYFRIFQGHDLMEFSQIKENTVFSMTDIHTLYVPKNALKAENVLLDVYYEYMKSRSKRDGYGLYNNEIGFDETNNRYLINGNEIRHIVILCDNFEKGGQTIRVLKAYLGIDSNLDEDIPTEFERIQRYYLLSGEGNVYIEDIIEKNRCDILVYGYYGTDEGKDKIEKFLSDHNLNGKVEYDRPITKKINSIYDSVRLVFGDNNVNREAYAVVREFNMTKCNVFPKEMMKNPKRAITLFLFKEEIKNKGRKKNQDNAYRNRTKSRRLGISALKEYFLRNGFRDVDNASASTLTVFSVLPPAMRIDVLESILEFDHNKVVLEKLSKAYAKAGKMEELENKLDEWVRIGYTDKEYADMLKVASEMLYLYLDQLPVAESLETARNNFEQVLEVTEAPEEFLEIMRDILKVV